jgi:hypothetical protein
MNPQALAGLLMEYMEFTSEVRNDANLGPNVKSQIMLQMAQALSSLVPLVNDDGGQAELKMKAQEHQMNLEVKRAELGFKQQEHAMKMQHSQAENEMKLQQARLDHASKIMQSQEAHESKLAQQKESAQQAEQYRQQKK